MVLLETQNTKLHDRKNSNESENIIKAKQLTHRQPDLKKTNLSRSGPSQRKASGYNLPIKVLGQGHHRVGGLTHHRTIKDEP